MHKHIATRFYTSAVFTEALLLHKSCFYTLLSHERCLLFYKTCLYTKTFLHKTGPAFTQALSLHKHCLYTSPAFCTKTFCDRSFLQPAKGQPLDGWRNAEGCKLKLMVVGWRAFRPPHRPDWPSIGPASPTWIMTWISQDKVSLPNAFAS